MVEEARLEQLDAGLTPVSEGWFVVSIPDAAWVTNEELAITVSVRVGRVRSAIDRDSHAKRTERP